MTIRRRSRGAGSCLTATGRGNVASAPSEEPIGSEIAEVTVIAVFPEARRVRGGLVAPMDRYLPRSPASPWQEAPSLSDHAYRAGTRSVVVLFAEACGREGPPFMSVV
jgi:hypothetical protein